MGGSGLVTQRIRIFIENAPTRMDQVREGLSKGDVPPGMVPLPMLDLGPYVAQEVGAL
jgi:hypothetical protein